VSQDNREKKTCVGFGELLWDCFPDERRPGGAPANVAYHAQMLGMRGVVASRVGSDDAGRELREFLKQQGLDTTHIQTDDRRPTGSVTVDLDAAGQPSYTIHENVAWDHIASTDALLDLAATANALCFGTLAQRSAATRDTLAACLERAGNSVLRVYDVNLRPPHDDRETIESSLRAADVLKLNEGEVKTISQLLQLGLAEPQFFAGTVLERYGVKLVCVTRGAEGCLLVDAAEAVEEPGIEIEQADPVGAGDSFSAALIYGVLNDWPLAAIAKLANRVAALIASNSGAMPAVRGEIEQIRAEVARAMS